MYIAVGDLSCFYFCKNGTYWCRMESLSLTVGLPYIQRCCKNGTYWCRMESLSLTVGCPYIQRCYKQLGDRPFEQRSYGPYGVMAKEKNFYQAIL